MTFVNSLKKAAEQKNANPLSVYGDANKPTETVEDQLDEVEVCETADDHDELSFAAVITLYKIGNLHIINLSAKRPSQWHDFSIFQHYSLLPRLT